MTLAIAIWVVLALITCIRNIYVQLVLADNWPPTRWNRIQWEAVIMLLTLSLIAWPFLIYFMASQKKQTTNTTDRKPS